MSRKTIQSVNCDIMRNQSRAINCATVDTVTPLTSSQCNFKYY